MDEDVAALRTAIQEFVSSHRQRPFGILREIGVQAELKRLADHHLGGRTHVLATVIDEPGGARAIEVETDRVRLEAKIYLPQEFAEDAELTRDRTDLLLYRAAGVSLFRHRSGPGDIVYKTLPESVSAAVEIKASPSIQLNQRIRYASDILRLLKLRNCGIAGFFLLLDKSSSLYREPDCPLNAMAGINWAPTPEASSLGGILNAEDPAWADIVVSANEPPDERTKYIEIWDVSAEEGRPQRLFAYRAVA